LNQPTDDGVRRQSESAVVIATLVNSVGNGMLMTMSVIYFHQQIGLSVAQIGAALAAGGLCRILAGSPLGHMADRFGAKRTLIALYLLLAVLQITYIAAGSFAGLVVVVCCASIVDAGAGAARGALIGQVSSDPSRRVSIRARLRSVTNIGLTAGAAVGGLSLYIDNIRIYHVMFVVNAVSTLCAGLVIRRVVAQESGSTPATAHRRSVISDYPYISLTFLTAVMSLHYSILEIAIPLWVAGNTNAPKWIVGALLIVNTVIVAAFQVRASRTIVDVRSAYRATRLSGYLLFAACAVYGASTFGNSAWAIAALLIASLLHVVAEMRQAAGAFLFSYHFAPDAAQGQYQGFWASGFSIATMASPLLYAALPLALGFVGWIVLGSLFAVSALSHRPVLRWAERRLPIENSAS
jgi:MFS family permease